MTYASSEGSDKQSGKCYCRVYKIDSWWHGFLVRSADSDRTGHMTKLVCDFSGRTGHFVGCCHVVAHRFNMLNCKVTTEEAGACCLL